MTGDPVILHWDGTGCDHAGDPQATADDPGGPLCPAGIPVTHVRLGGQVMTIEESRVAFRALVTAITEAADLLLFARIDFAIRRDCQLTADEWLAKALATGWCYPDGCPASVCGGPHYEIQVMGAAVIVPAGATVADIEAAVAYARHVYGEEADGR